MRADPQQAPDTPPSSPPVAPHPPATSGGARFLRGLRNFFLGVLGLIVALGLSGAMLGATALAVAFPNLPDISGLMDYRPRLPLRVLSADGVILGEFGEERRQFTPIAAIPPVMKNAVLAIEDSRFYEHGGVDYSGILRAGLANLAEARSQGASTITMQVARNFYLSSEKTFTRKIYEILLALKIERQLNKDQILEIYMNQIFLGHRAYGFAAASETYFGKPLRQLSIAEAAMLAGLPKAPSSYNPLSNPKRAMIRQQYIIDRMLENGFITPQEHSAAKAEKLVYRTASKLPTHAEFAAEAARQLVFEHYGEDTYTRGLNVYLTLDSRDQEVAYRALRRGIMDFERRQAYRGPEAYLDLPADLPDTDIRLAEALQDHPDYDELRAAVVLNASPKGVEAVLESGEVLKLTGDSLRAAASALNPKGNPQTRIRRGAVIRVMQGNKGQWAILNRPEVEGAFVALDPQTGAVRALVGGYDFARNKFNHVTQAWRQPGSSFKPFIYSAGLEKGITPSTIVLDAPMFFGANVTGSQPWEPKNYDGRFEGAMPVRRALAKSKNIPSIRIIQSVGPEKAQAWIARFGFDAAKHPPYLTTALGAGSVTPMQVASAYAVFANGGYFVPPVIITRITDDKGRVLSEAHLQAPQESQRVIEGRNAFVMNSLLMEVARSGTAAKASATLKRSDLAGKTGTTNDAMDAWFAGYQPSLVGVVWMGYDTPKKLGDRETGGGLSLPIWMEYMAYALKGVPEATYTPPPGLTKVGAEWYFEEFRPGNGAIANLGGWGSAPRPGRVPAAGDTGERQEVLDMFQNGGDTGGGGGGGGEGGGGGGADAPPDPPSP